jgi:hypothetical protein
MAAYILRGISQDNKKEYGKSFGIGIDLTVLEGLNYRETAEYLEEFIQDFLFDLEFMWRKTWQRKGPEKFPEYWLGYRDPFWREKKKRKAA